MASARRWCAVVALSLLGASPAAAQEGKSKEGASPEAPDIAALEKSLGQAMSGGHFESAKAIIDQLAAAGDSRAYGAILQHALTGASYAVEKNAARALADCKDPKSRAAILESAMFQKNPKYKARIILLSVAATIAADEPAALNVLHNALKDPSKPVLLKALYWIRDLKRRESVEPLIQELEAREKKPHDRVHDDIVKALQAITAAELEAAADWRNYWEARNKAGAEPKKPAQSLTRVVKRPAFFTVDVDSDRVLFVIDVSGSMTERDPELPRTAGSASEKRGEEKAGTTVVGKKAEKQEKPEKAKAPSASRERLFRVKEELIRVVRGLQAPTRFGILSFSHELEWWGGARSLKEASAANKSSAESWVRNLAASGATRTDKALEEALSLPDVDTMYLLTDGAPKDEHDKRLEIEPILAYAKEANRFLSCRIHTISFAQIKDRRMVTFVRQLAAQNDGVCTMLP